MISAGGALGACSSALIAPRIFNTYYEWKLGLLGRDPYGRHVPLEHRRISAFRRRDAASDLLAKSREDDLGFRARLIDCSRLSGF
jgi:hypothetical protein